MSFEAMPRDAIDPDVDRLVLTHVRKLRLAEIGDDVGLRKGYYGQQRVPLGNVGADTHGTLSNHACLWCRYPGIGEVQVRLAQRRLVSGQRSLGHFNTGSQDVEGFHRSHARGLIAIAGRLKLVQISFSLLSLLLSTRSRVGEVQIALRVV